MACHYGGLNCSAIRATSVMNICCSIEEEFDLFFEAVLCCRYKWRAVVLIQSVNIHAKVEKVSR